MSRRLILPITALLIFLCVNGCASKKEDAALRVAVEFNSHAACAHIAGAQDLFRAYGLSVTAFNKYLTRMLTRMALAAALARGEVDVAYICLTPAISLYANGKVPVKVVAGTHRYGYGLIVDPAKVESVADLEKPGMLIGCPREGSPCDVLLHTLIAKYRLNKEMVLSSGDRGPGITRRRQGGPAA